MKKMSIIYWKKRNYEGIDFMEYTLMERHLCDNLMIQGQDLIYIGETQKKTKQLRENWLFTQKEKLKKAWYDYWNVVCKLEYWK